MLVDRGRAVEPLSRACAQRLRHERTGSSQYLRKWGTGSTPACLMTPLENGDLMQGTPFDVEKVRPQVLSLRHR